MVSESQPRGEPRSVQLSPSHLHAVIPCASLGCEQPTDRRPSRMGSRFVTLKLWAWRRWVALQYQWKGIGRARLKLVELRLYTKVRLLRIRRRNRPGHNESQFGPDALKAVHAKSTP